MKACEMFLMPGDDDMGQRVIPTYKTGSQEPKEEMFSFICNNEMISDMNKRKEVNNIYIKYTDTNAYSTRVSNRRLTIFLIGMVITKMQIIAPIK